MKILNIAIGFAISILFLYLALRGIDFSALCRSLSEVQVVWLFPAVLVHLSSFWVRSQRWGVMLEHLKPVPVARLFPVLSISYMANNTLPLRAGEFVRAYFLGKNEDVSKTAGFSSVILERVCDGLTLLLFLAYVALQASLPGWAKQIGLLATAGFVGIMVLMVGLVFFRERTLALTHWFLSRLPHSFQTKCERILSRFISGLDVLQSRRRLLLVLGFSILVWALEAAALFLVAIACNLAIPAMGAVFALIIINLGIMIPSSPGYMGTFEFFCVKSLEAYSVSSSQAMGFALILHVLQFLPITLIGLFFLVRSSTNLRLALQGGVNL